MDLPLHDSCFTIQLHHSGLIAVDKAAGILSHPNKTQTDRLALLQVPYDFEEEAYQQGTRKWYLLNRLDAPTSGVILLAADKDLAMAVKEEFARHNVEKTYLALVKGIPPNKKDIWRDRLEVEKRGGRLRTRVIPGKPNSETSMIFEQRGEGPPARALLKLNPSTGRTHQLRVQCANRRLPIIGDATYGDFVFNRNFRKKTEEDRLYLHSFQTKLDFRYRDGRIVFHAESKLPEIFAIALQ